MARQVYDKGGLDAASGFLQYSTGILLAAFAFSLTAPSLMPLMAHRDVALFGWLLTCLAITGAAFVVSVISGILSFARIMSMRAEKKGNLYDPDLAMRAMIHLCALVLGIVALIFALIIGFYWQPRVTTPSEAISIALQRLGVQQSSVEKTTVELLSFGDAHTATWHVTLTWLEPKNGAQKAKERTVGVFIEPETSQATCIPTFRQCKAPN